MTKSIATQESLVDRYGRLRAFRNGYRDKKNVPRHVTRNIHTGNTAFSRVGVNYDAPFIITFATKTFG